MKKKWIKRIAVLMMLMCSAWGCGAANQPTKGSEIDAEMTTEELTLGATTEAFTEDTSAEVVVETTEAVTEEETEFEPVERQLTFAYRNVAYRRLNSEENFSAQIISSRTELLECQNKYRDVLDFDFEVHIADAATDVFCQSFNSAVELYDEAWFAEHRLIIRTVSESMTYYYYKVTDVSLEKDVLNIEYERHSPMDFAPVPSKMFIFLELEISDLPENVTTNWTKTIVPFPWEDYMPKETEGN